MLPGAGAPPSDLGFRGLLDKSGVKLGDDIVIDPANALAQMGAEVLLADKYGNHPIVRSFAAERLGVIFQLARSVTKAEKPVGATCASQRPVSSARSRDDATC